VNLKVIAAGFLALTAGAAARRTSTERERPFPTRSTPSGLASTTRLHPNVKINYQSIGSGGGIRQVSEGTVDFGATMAR
jgi:phosphate transport system substrate-binding protein